MNYLTCDIGNSFIKFGLYSEGVLKYFDKIVHDDFGNAIISKLEFEKVGISSVVPEKSQELIKLFKTQFDISPIIISQHSKFQFENCYGTPYSVGTDRLCGLEGALQKYYSDSGESVLIKKILVTIDFGTATTINILKSPAKFVGGLIAPGLTTMAQSLNAGTSQLPNTELSKYENIIGNNTSQCIASGILNSTIGMIERTLNYLSHESNEELLVFTTGGNAETIIPHLTFEHTFVADLVLRGINSIVSRTETSQA